MELSVSVQLHMLIRIYVFELGVIIGLSGLLRICYKSYGSFCRLDFHWRTYTNTRNPARNPARDGLFDFVREHSGVVEICDFCNHIDCSNRTITYGEWGNSNMVHIVR